MAIILSLAVLGTALVNYLLPRSYTSTAAVLVDVKTPDPIAGIVFPGMASPSYMATQVDVIQSDRVSHHVVRTLRLDESEPMREKWRDGTKGVGNFQSWLADVLRNPEIKAIIEKQGFRPGGNSSAEFTKFFRTEVEKFAALVKAAGIKPEN